MLVNIVYFPVTLLLIFSINNIVECLANPAEFIVLLESQHVHRFIERLKVGNDAYKSGEGDHRGERFRFVADWFGEEHEGRRDEVLGN
jgi:hypothetical protein